LLLYIRFLSTVSKYRGNPSVSGNNQITIHKTIKFYKYLLLWRSLCAWLWSLFKNSLNILVVSLINYHSVLRITMWWRAQSSISINICYLHSLIQCRSLIRVLLSLLSIIFLRCLHPFSVIHLLLCSILNLENSLHFCIYLLYFLQNLNLIISINSFYFIIITNPIFLKMFL
jgi:hypothetical protein